MTYRSLAGGQQDDGDVLQIGSERPPHRSWLPLMLLAAMAVAAGAVTIAHSGGHRGRAKPPPVSVRELGHPMLGVRAGWELFARGSDSVVRIQLAAGRITTTQVPALGSSSPEVAFIVGRHDAVIRSFDEVPGYVVPDGLPVRRLTGVLAAVDDAGPLLPGPRPGQSWVLAAHVGSASLKLIGPDGRPTGTSARLPPDGALPATAVPDGRGNALLLTSSNALYDASAARYWLVRATILAVGPARWLGFTCQGEHCHDVVVDAITGARRALPTSAFPLEPAFAWPSLGVTSPDGRFAAVPASNGMGTTLHLINLSTGADRPVGAAMSPSPGYQIMAWSPDSQWLFVAAAEGRLAAISARTGKATSLGVPLPAVSQIAVRAAPGSGP